MYLKEVGLQIYPFIGKINGAHNLTIPGRLPHGEGTPGKH